MKRLLFISYVVFILSNIIAGVSIDADFFRLKKPAVYDWFSVSPLPFSLDRSYSLGNPTQATSIYRGSNERLGVDLKSELSEGLHERWYFPKLNVGVHGASKASPAIDESGVYIGSDDGWFYALDHDGRIRWRHFASDSARGIHATVALDEDTVYLPTYSGDLLALDKKTGRVLWINKTSETIGSSPALFEDSILVACEVSAPRYDGYVLRIDRRTGQVRWRTSYLGEQSHTSPTIDSANGLVYVGANNGHIFAFRLADGRQAWESSIGGAVKGTMSLVDGFIYFATWGKAVFAVEAKTGSVKWKTPIQGRSQSSVTIVPELNVAIVSSEEGAIYGLDRKTGSVKWRYETGSNLSRKPSALVTKIQRSSRLMAWIGCGARLLCVLDPATGKLVRKIDLKGVLSGVPVAFGHALYVALDEAGLQKFE